MSINKLFFLNNTEIIWWTVSGDTLSNRQEMALPENSECIDANESWVVVGGTTDEDLLVYPRTGGGETLGTLVRTTLPSAFNEDIKGLGFSNQDENLLAVVQERLFSVVRLDSSGNATVLDSIATNFSGRASADWSDNDTKIVFSDGSGDGFVYASWDGSSITKLATYNVGADTRPLFASDGTRVFAAELGESTGDTVHLYSVGASSLSLLDSVAHPVSSWEWAKPNKEATFAFGGVRSATGTPKLWQIESNAFSQVATFSHPVWHGAWLDENTVVVTDAEGGVVDKVYVYTVSASGLTESQVVEESGGIAQVGDMVYVPATGPTTNEELFDASYADASAALPKITALIRPADVQRSIDTDVSNLKDGPNFYTVECIFDLGELENLNPYNATTEKPRVFFVKDDQPGLRDGKNLLLKSYQLRSADPSVPVTCTFWGY